MRAGSQRRQPDMNVHICNTKNASLSAAISILCVYYIAHMKGVHHEGNGAVFINMLLQGLLRHLWCQCQHLP